MMNFRSWGIIILLRVYVTVALIVAAVLSPLTFSVIPVLILIWYLYLWRSHARPIVNLLTDAYVFLAIIVLLAPVTGPFIALITLLPVLALVGYRLKETARSVSVSEGFAGDTENKKYATYPTRIYLTLAASAGLALALSLLLGALALLLGSLTLIVYLGFLGVVILRRFPAKPVEEAQIQVRMVAGSHDAFEIKLTRKAGTSGKLFLKSPYEWVKVSSDVLSMNDSELTVKLSLSPALSGPTAIRLPCIAVDSFGLIERRFELEPIVLFVIPRSRYAAWLARKYLAETRPGSLPLLSDIGALKTIRGARRGVDYYGNRVYQPGDSLKNIDWKHSFKYHDLVTKEFVDITGQPAVLLVNLTVGTNEEADKLACNLIMTAVSLARENIPAALAAYDHKRVLLTTGALSPRELVQRALRIAREMVIIVNPVRYLNPPDVTRLRANMSRLRIAESDASKKLLGLLEIEYRSLSENTKLNPATKALQEVFTRVDKQSSVVVISGHNHDAEALAFHAFNLAQKGNAIISV
ncbi:DUF58 domain-containing protein [bacterium]|nr:MAG: DUF58 domain-containing protein [bacterium]